MEGVSLCVVLMVTLCAVMTSDALRGHVHDVNKVTDQSPATVQKQNSPAGETKPDAVKMVEENQDLQGHGHSKQTREQARRVNVHLSKTRLNTNGRREGQKRRSVRERTTLDTRRDSREVTADTRRDTRREVTADTRRDTRREVTADTRRADTRRDTRRKDTVSTAMDHDIAKKYPTNFAGHHENIISNQGNHISNLERKAPSQDYIWESPNTHHYEVSNYCSKNNPAVCSEEPIFEQDHIQADDNFSSWDCGTISKTLMVGFAGLLTTRAMKSA